MKAAALVAALTVPNSSFVGSAMHVQRSDDYTAQVYVQTGQLVDITLPPGESTTSNAFTGDGRWSIGTFVDGIAVHVTVKPETGASPQRLMIPTSYKTIHLLLSSGNAEGRIVSVIFNEPSAVRMPIARQTPAPARPRPQPTPRVQAIKSCDGLDSAYKWKGSDNVDFTRV